MCKKIQLKIVHTNLRGVMGKKKVFFRKRLSFLASFKSLILVLFTIIIISSCQKLLIFHAQVSTHENSLEKFPQQLKCKYAFVDMKDRKMTSERCTVSQIA